ncbi:polyprenyl synthetase family protein [Kitasatospora aureofaciens]|uniref:polyprenyl synthetase family protein n=1 Tax=Kitasatospora aureofaciens TaxID=1894 RepID=UPI001C46688A|nr:polyprenyl synthetase family protein [Kitasatospora aureofaciens]MBV6695604.1 polyprenyl synthetase family protein [Kitasatospora aureofaciens]
MTELSSQGDVPIPRRPAGGRAARVSGEPTPTTIVSLLEAEFDRLWPDGVTGLDAVHRYAVIPTGKLLRPSLVVHAALVVGGDLGAVLPAAAGIEGAHVGSLMHDDIIDRDGERRGRKAVHTAFGPAQAIIAGNALFFAWFAALAECARRGVPADRVQRAMAVQAGAGTAICRGAFEELTMRGDLDHSVDDYLAMARGKTAALFEAACRVGSILGGGDDHATDLLGTFGDHLGIAFQIRDDLLPYESATAHLMGKPADSDLRNHCPTLPVLLAHQRADTAARAALRHTLSDKTDPQTALHRMRALLEETGALKTAHAMADHHARLARYAISQLPASAHTRALSHLTRTPAKAAPLPSA